MFLALKELTYSKGRFIMISLIIVLISWLVFFLAGLGNGLSDLGAATLKYAPVDYAVYEENSDFSFSKSMLSESLADDLLKEKGVTAVAPIGTASASIRQRNSDEETASKMDVLIVGIRPGSFMEPNVTTGKSLQASNPAGVIVDHALELEGFKLGDKLTINGSTQEMEISGFTKNQSLSHQPVVFSSLEKLREYKYAAPGSDNGIKDAVNSVLIQGEESEPKEIEQSISGVQVGSKKETINAVPGYAAENGTISMMVGFLIIISAIIIAVFFYILTSQKIQQFGVMKAIGGSNWFIIKSVVSQVFILSIVSILIGILLTYVTAAALPDSMPFNLINSLVISYSLVLLAISVISSFFSVLKIAKIDPLTALGGKE
ncbi:putative ABC transport system permease protein [Carnobacterium iners]|uniref:Putative hemin transport system permease protein HrtB n=1 Tax=Carnobacterium iners TaxID=1073423 RepID=A0A1X7N1S3_9LACT|nr:ABC transporter permease [Carnobacterium iners]SEK96262.1 putative ABC transport system permease protein [Carnobacterium iners]SMH31225.1 putative ABC transport system permease protein [Carnobacterium iners]